MDGRLVAAPQMAMPDGPAPGGYPTLVGHPVAVIVFTVVVNRQAGVFNLTGNQLHGIFSGTITKLAAGTLLERVNGHPGAIGYARISDAATFTDVETIKLNGWDPQIGAVERGSYPYWTVEYLYTPCVDRQVSLPTTLCAVSAAGGA